MDDQSTKEVDNKQASWSELPTDLMWMVKDKLNRVDNARIPFICHHWSSASLGYPTKTQDNWVDVPWLMHHPFSSNECEFINISTMEKLVLDLPEFHLSTNFFLFSKRGWLLFRRLTEGSDTFLVLFNPLTSSSIILPEPQNSTKGLYASFSLSDDKEGVPQPQYIVLLGGYGMTTLRLQIGKVRDSTWESYSYVYSRTVYRIGSLVIHGQKVYHLDEVGELLIFDIDNQVWTRIVKNVQLRKPFMDIRWWMMESEGKIVKIGGTLNMITFRFYKLNDNETGWEELNDDNNMSWFLHGRRRNNHFPIKEIGAKNKVYRIETNEEEKEPSYRDAVFVYNKIDSSMLSYKLNHGTLWVDMGSMDKLPSSCKKYASI